MIELSSLTVCDTRHWQSLMKHFHTVKVHAKLTCITESCHITALSVSCQTQQQSRSHCVPNLRIWRQFGEDSLQMVLNAAASLVVSLGKYQHITPVLRDILQRLPVPQRIQFKIAALAFDCVWGTVKRFQSCRPHSGWHLWPFWSPFGCARWSRGQRTSGTLPPHLHSPSISRRQFRAVLKTHLFKEAYTDNLWELLLKCDLNWTKLKRPQSTGKDYDNKSAQEIKWIR